MAGKSTSRKIHGGRGPLTPGKILFLCTHNSARSQMAEGLFRHKYPHREVASAGTLATRVRSEAIEVLRELGADISEQTSKTYERFLDEAIETVVTVCDGARESCPVFPSARRSLHWSIADPAAVEGDRQERLEAFRVARDELAARIETAFGAAGSEATATDPAR